MLVVCRCGQAIQAVDMAIKIFDDTDGWSPYGCTDGVQVIPLSQSVLLKQLVQVYLCAPRGILNSLAILFAAARHSGVRSANGQALSSYHRIRGGLCTRMRIYAIGYTELSVGLSTY